MDTIVDFRSNRFWLLAIVYIFALLLSNWFDPRLIKIGAIIVDSGTLIFPITFIVSDLLTEVYGFRNARYVILLGLMLNLVYIALGFIITNLPSTDSSGSHHFDEFFKLDVRIIIASITSYILGETINAVFVSKLKMLWHGKFIALRYVGSTTIAAFIDSIVFTLIAFAGTMVHRELFILAITMWLCKVLVEIIGLPLSLYLTKRIKRIEQIDVYDYGVKYHLFTFASRYGNENNRYQRG